MSTNETVNSDAIHAGAPDIHRATVDLTVLASYEEVQLDGEPDLIIELIDLHRGEAPRRVAVMRESLAKRNWPAVKREAYSLKGSSGHVGATQVALICDEIERIESENLFPRIEVLLNWLDQELEQVLRILLAERQRRAL